MSIVIETEPVPLGIDSGGGVRVVGTRVTLDAIVACYRLGFTAERIAKKYPSVQLDQVYAVLGYYLRHREEVEAYLRDREQRAKEIREQNETRFDPSGVRDRLESRREGKQDP